MSKDENYFDIEYDKEDIDHLEFLINFPDDDDDIELIFSNQKNDFKSNLSDKTDADILTKGKIPNNRDENFQKLSNDEIVFLGETRKSMNLFVKF